MVNAPLLLETLEHIKNNPQTWRQDVWFGYIDPKTDERIFTPVTVEMIEENRCGSAFCFAGHAAIKSGFPAPPTDPYAPWMTNGVWAEDYAREKLGITPEQAEVLFHAGNSMEDLETLVNAIIENPEIDGDELYDLVGPDDEDDEDYW